MTLIFIQRKLEEKFIGWVASKGLLKSIISSNYEFHGDSTDKILACMSFLSILYSVEIAKSTKARK